MGYKGTIRSIGSVINQMERASIRRQKELEKQRKQYDKMQELEKAAYEVEEYENYIERMLTLHIDCSSKYNWSEILKQNPPEEPKRESCYENDAKNKREAYHPNFFQKALKIDKKRYLKFDEEISISKGKDEYEFANKNNQYDKELQEYNELIDLAKNINNGSIVHYKKAFDEICPLAEIEGIGSTIDVEYLSSIKVKVYVSVHDEKVIPKQSKALLKSGKLSLKEIPLSKYNELYQDYICSASIRIARELFALLPLEEVIVISKGKVLSTITGKLEEKPILAVKFVADTIKDINFEAVDPSDCMKNFVHNMGFKKNIGMQVVDEIF
jgi:hypothetical protein